MKIQESGENDVIYIVHISVYILYNLLAKICYIIVYFLSFMYIWSDKLFNTTKLLQEFSCFQYKD